MDIVVVPRRTVTPLSNWATYQRIVTEPDVEFLTKRMVLEFNRFPLTQLWDGLVLFDLSVKKRIDFVESNDGMVTSCVAAVNVTSPVRTRLIDAASALDVIPTNSSNPAIRSSVHRIIVQLLLTLKDSIS